MYRRLSLFRKNIFPFSSGSPFAYDNASDVTFRHIFSAKFAAIFPSPRKQGDEATNPITEY